MKSLASFSPRANNFDAIRFAMASLVILSHCWLLLGREDPAIAWTGGAASLGTLAVDVFFILSGYLVSMSWERSRSPLQYLGKRVARIYPAFIVITLLCALVLAPLVMRPGLPRFELSNLGRMLKSCVTLIQYRAPGAFWRNPAPDGLYAPVWTIEYEFRCYLLTLLIGLIAGRGARAKGVLLVLWIAAIVASVHGLPHWSGGRIADFALLETYNWPRFLSTYLAGSLAWHFRDRIPVSAWTALLCLLVLPAMHWPAGYRLLMPTCGAYLVFWLAFQTYVRLHAFGRHGDFSYGIYLYAYPIQQLLIFYLGDRLSVGVLFILSTPLAIVAGILSWHLVEKHFLPRRAKPARATSVAEARGEDLLNTAAGDNAGERGP